MGSSIEKRKEKEKGNKTCKICTKMPFCPTGQEFWLEYNAVVFATKFVDGIFSGPTKKMENCFERKKKLCKICAKIPLVPIGHEFRPECNISFFARNLVDSIFRGL